MPVKVIRSFSDKARADQVLGDKLKSCEKIREVLALGKENGFNIDEASLYPPNEPQFTADQLSEKMVKALLRA